MIEINGDKYYHVFTAGKYPQGEISDDFLKQAANNYNPVNFHEAPVWIGHPGKEIIEPEALGWIGRLAAKGEKLYASFSHISEKLKSLIENKKFKRCSVELVTFNVAGRDFPYLYAIGITNRPAVKGLEPISFLEPVTFAGHNFKTDDISTKLKFNSEIKHFNQTQTLNMNELLKNLAEKLKLDVLKFDTDEKISKELIRVFEDRSNEILLLKNKVSKLQENELSAPATEKYSELVDELNKLKKSRASELVENAVLTKKLLPSQKEDLISFAETDYERCKTFIGKLELNPVFSAKMINDKTFSYSDLSDPKFTKPDGSKITYEDILRDLTLQSKFTDDEISALRKNSAKFKD
jgi:hypothetical protein